MSRGTGRRRPALAGLLVLVAVLGAALVAVLVTGPREVDGTATPGGSSVAPGSVVPTAELAGRWTGKGTLSAAPGSTAAPAPAR